MTDEILALLEAGPVDQKQLADWLRVEPSELRSALKTLKAAGQIKQTGLGEKWALASFTPIKGRRPEPDPPDLTSLLVGLLASGPKASSAIATALKWGRTTTHRRLLQIEAAGLIKKTWVGRLAAWALPSYVGPPPEGRRHTPWQGSEFGRTQAPSPQEAAGLRQPAPVSTVAKDADPSWWVNRPPSGFTHVATAEFARMRTSKEHLRMGLRILQ